MNFRPGYCQHCGSWIKQHESAGRPRQYCDKRCFHARKAADDLGLIVLKAADLVPILAHFEVIGRIFERAHHPGCAEWLLRLAEAVHRDTGNYHRFGDFLRWLDGQENIDWSSEWTYAYGGDQWGLCLRSSLERL